MEKKGKKIHNINQQSICNLFGNKIKSPKKNDKRERMSEGRNERDETTTKRNEKKKHTYIYIICRQISG